MGATDVATADALGVRLIAFQKPPYVAGRPT